MPIADLKTMGRSIASRRVSRGLSQKELAESAGISASAIAGYENAEYGPSFLKAAAIADALGCSLDDFLRLPD